jgi:hypothetical protein
MARTIYITESQTRLIAEANEEVTFYKFFTEIKNFLKEILADPIHGQPGEFFKLHSIGRSKLLNKLMDFNIITKKEGFDEPADADNKKKSVHKLQYSVPKKNFERKIHRLYTYFFERNEKVNEDILKEDGEGGMMGGDGGSFDGSEGATNANISANAMYDVPFGAVQRRTIYNTKTQKNVNSKKNISTVDMSPALDRKNGVGGSISVNVYKQPKK